MKKALTTSIMLFTVLNLTYAQRADQIIARTIEAYGGKVWDKVRYVKSKQFSHYHWLEQSESPEGPQLTTYEDSEEIHSVDEIKLYRKAQYKYFQTGGSVPSETTVNGSYGTIKYGNSSPYPFGTFSGQLGRQKAWLQYSPERLLRVLANAKLTYEKEVSVAGVAHHQIAYSYMELQGKVLINNNTGLITEAWFDSYFPNEYYFSIWGKFTTRVQYSLYGLFKGNLFYPQQWDIWRNGQFWSQVTFPKVEFLESTDESVFNVSDEVKSKYPPDIKLKEKKVPFENAREVVPGIQLVEEDWNTAWVEHDNGIVVIEAPISSWYSKQVVDELKKRYPQKVIKGAIVTSDAWPHMGGAREYMANKVPIYSSYLNEGILNKLVQSDYTLDPDSYQQNKVKPIFRWIKEPVTIEDSKMPMTIYPIDGEGGERMTVVYFPKQKLLYATDLIQYLNPQKKIFFFPEYLHEVNNAVKRYKLDVETVYAMHLLPTPWKEIEEALAKHISN